jgi:hypothetical protein
VTLALADDQGTEYTSGHVVSTTNVGPGYYHGRVEYQFTPTLNPDARELQVSVPNLRWEYREANRCVALVDGDRRRKHGWALG